MALKNIRKYLGNRRGKLTSRLSEAEHYTIRINITQERNNNADVCGSREWSQ